MERNDYRDPYLEAKEVDPDRMYEEWRDRKMSDIGFKQYAMLLPSGERVHLASEEDMFRMQKALDDSATSSENKNRHNAQWLRFAEAAPVLLAHNIGQVKDGADAAAICADFADAMLEEARKRGKL